MKICINSKGSLQTHRQALARMTRMEIGIGGRRQWWWQLGGSSYCWLGVKENKEMKEIEEGDEGQRWRRNQREKVEKMASRGSDQHVGSGKLWL